MRILIAGGSTGGYQTRRLQEEAAKRGHSADVGRTKTLTAAFSGDVISMTVGGTDLLSYDLLRLLCIEKNPALWLTAADFLRQNGKAVVDQRPFVLSNPLLSMSGEYCLSQQRGLRFPRSVVTQSLKIATQVAEGFGYPCIVKTTHSRKGRGVGLVMTPVDLSLFFSQHVCDHVCFVVREFIPNDGDLRVLVIGGRVLGALHRRPKAGDFRANISQGGSGSVFDLATRPDIVAMAEHAASMCGLAIAGVDIMLHRETGEVYLLEVNESPQIEGFETYTGINAAGAMIEYFETLVEKKNV